MKKFIISAFCLGCICSFATANTTNTTTNEYTVDANANVYWEDYTTVYTIAKKSGRMWITNRSQSGHAVQIDENGNLRINYKGQWCRVSYSDVDNYTYKFSSSSGTWYFNI